MDQKHLEPTNWSLSTVH